MQPDDEERCRRARAIWGYSRQPQEQLADAAGIHYDRLRAILGRTGRPPTIDELLLLAHVASASSMRPSQTKRSAIASPGAWPVAASCIIAAPQLLDLDHANAPTLAPIDLALRALRHLFGVSRKVHTFSCPLTPISCSIGNPR